MLVPYVAEASGNLAPDAVEDGRVKDIPRGNFMLMVHPFDWQMNAAGRLVPVVVQIGKEVGNGAVSRKGNFNAHRLEHEQRGYVMVPHDLLGEDYVVVFRNELGKKVHRTVFENPVPGLNSTEWEFRAGAWEKFLKLLRLRGIVKAPQPQTVRELLRQRRWLEADKIRRGPRAQTTEMLDRYDREMRQLRDSIVYLEDELKASIEVYGDNRGEIDDQLDALLEAEIEGMSAVSSEVKATTEAARPARQRRQRGPRKEKPQHTPNVAEPPAGADDAIDGDQVEDDDE